MVISCLIFISDIYFSISINSPWDSLIVTKKLLLRLIQSLVHVQMSSSEKSVKLSKSMAHLPLSLDILASNSYVEINMESYTRVGPPNSIITSNFLKKYIVFLIFQKCALFLEWFHDINSSLPTNLDMSDPRTGG